MEGNPLDGEWINPAHLTTTNTAVSEFPSGDGNAGGDFNFVLTLLPGDRNRNNIVSQPDPEFEQWTEWEFGNFNGDGTVDELDMDLLIANSGKNRQNLFLLADLDGDWNVSQADLDILFANWENNLQNPTQADGDLDVDGDIDVDDLDLAFAQFGMQLSVVS